MSTSIYTAGRSHFSHYRIDYERYRVITLDANSERSFVLLLGMLIVALLAQVRLQALPTGSLLDTAEHQLKIPLQFTPNVGMFAAPRFLADMWC